MKIEKSIEITIDLEDLKKLVSEKLGISEKDIQIKPTTKLESEPGLDPHDSCDFEVFSGLKITYKE